MHNIEGSDLPCGCRKIKTIRLCPYHEGYEDGFEAGRKDQELKKEKKNG